HLAGLTSPSPPRRPPVPYTTLFRSAGHGHLRTVLPALRSPVAGQQRGSAPGLSLVPGVPGDLHRHVGAEPVAAHRSFRGPGALGDRKSTRLNSSHVKISYAVFCSKK